MEDMKTSINVFLTTQNDALEFAYIASNCKTTITGQRGEYKVNAASVLGLMSLDITQPIEICFKNYAEYVAYADKFAKWTVK
jgi:hypothetical protein